ncbi:hypothetical protein RE428_13280 [Marinobacter nanhaiticus D15-8W]|uniref:Protein kinase domain-containing protein n=1 Tax=Marinobacter nanhaiticus D15-8W TaxID=626887 RepID=N6VYL1_9GAMM|nr:methyltransferase [Marinobacter nanhaiticus]ENO12959.1 hypothetical protein J057_16215 [Marinobacter nanhaiticus D15-8W]BES70310.1 hypothetical protein RE428_13280 [Marinobacter nanhaiticus D15-8W]
MDKDLQWADVIVGHQPFTRGDIGSQPAASLSSLYRTRWGQARVSRGLVAGHEWVIKDVSGNRVTKYLWGRWLLAREYRALKLLMNLPGVPREPFMLDRDALCYRYIGGTTLRERRERNDKLDAGFFLRLEGTLRQIHDRGVVHMDLGNTRNILVADETGEPGVIDFGSCVFTQFVPKQLTHRLQRMDYSRLYKSWARLAPESLDDDRTRYLQAYYHRHHSKPKHWGRDMTHAIRQFFHNATFRQWFRKLRVPLGIALLVLIMSEISAAWYWPGAAVALVGALLQAWSFACIDTQKVLADKGPYSLVRNPQYITRFLLVIGVVMMTGSPWLVLATMALYYFYAVTRVEREEALLPTVFGDAYRDYCERVPRFVPRLTNLDRERLLHWNWHAFRKNHGASNLATVLACLGILYIWAFHIVDQAS